MADFVLEESTTTTELPIILVLGGCGFIGRNLVHHMVATHQAQFIKVTDKAIPEMSYFHEKFLEAFQSPIVQYQQNDLTKQQHVDRAFTVPPEFNKPCFDVVINLAAETRQAQPPELYTSRGKLLAKMCALKAVEMSVPRFVQISTAQVYQCSRRISPNSKPAVESSTLEPWTPEAKSTQEGEVEVLAHSETMEVVILRLAYVYGEGDTQMIMTRAVCGAAYTELKEEMTLLWGGQLKINTVHVLDVCRAIVHVMDRTKVRGKSVLNLCDKNDTTQEKVTQFLKEIFKIKYSFYGRIMSNLASLRMSDVVKTANEKHLKPWNDLCLRDGVLNTPLSPYMSADWLECHHLDVCGEAIEGTGFRYEFPFMTEDLLRGSIEHAIESGVFPPSCYGGNL